MKAFLLILFYSSYLFSCTLCHTQNVEHETLVGRNFDWSSSGGKINFIPANNRYFGMVLLTQKGSNMPYEGMNTKGLFVGISAVSHTSTTLNPFKPIRKSLEMVRVLLQEASNIEEAIKLFDRYSIAFGEFLGNPLIHFKIVQKDGQSVVVEFVENRMVIVRDERAKIMTNHYLSNGSIKSENKTSYKRYKIVKDNLHKSNSVEKLFKLLDSVKQPHTVWTSIYNLREQVIYVKYQEGEIKKFRLKDELYQNREAYHYDMKNFNQKRLMVEKDAKFKIRTHFGYGSENTKHYGARILLNSSDTQSYGLEISKFKRENNDFEAIGIVLEQRLWEWFSMSIGTVGYFDYEVKGENVMGLVSNLGWEPNNHIPFKPYITYRSDTIFGKEKTKVLHSISVGFTFEF